MSQLLPLADEVNVGDIKIGEAFQSGSFSREEGENPSVSIKFIITGAVDAYPAYIALMRYLRNYYWSDVLGCCASYNPPLQNVSLQSMDCNYAYEATCTYNYPNENDTRNRERQGISQNNPVINEPTFQMPDVEDNDFSFTISGEQAHIVQGYSTKRYWKSTGTTKVDYKNCIGWNGDSFEGVDVISPFSSFSVRISAPNNWITTAYRNLLISYIGSVNNYPWAGFPRGCVLYKGAQINPVALNYTDENGESVKDWYWRITYEFDARSPVAIYHPDYNPEASTNPSWVDENDQPVGNYVMREGFQYVWDTYTRQTINEVTFSTPNQMNIVDIYLHNDFTNLGIPGLVSEYPSGSGSGSGSGE